mgnify:CR=1 FL=1
MGTGLGYSSLWLGLGLLDAGVPGVLYTIEEHEERARRAEAYLGRAGLSGRVEVLCGEAEELIPSLEGDLDLVFLDPGAVGHLAHAQLAEPKMRTGAVLLTHDVLDLLAWGTPELLKRI